MASTVVTVGRRLQSTTPLRVLMLAILLATWEMAARSGLFYEGVFPPLLSILSRFADLFTPTMYEHARVTLVEIALSIAIGGAAGVSAGLLLGRPTIFGKAFEPVLYYLAPTPKIVFLPIVFSLFGVYMGSKVAIGAMSAFFPVAMSVASGMKDLNPVFLRVSRSFRATRLQEVRKVMLPALAVPIITGLRLGFGLAIVGVLLAETKISNQGIGFIAIQYYGHFRIADLYAVLIAIFAFAGIVNALLQKAEGRIRLH